MPAITPKFKKVLLFLIAGILIAAPLVSLAQTAPTTASVAATADKNPDTCGTFDLVCKGIGLFNAGVLMIGQWIAYAAAFLISLAVDIIQVIIDAGRQIISSEFVQTGFRVTLDIANLGFVLAIIIIAFTTILRLSGYNTKQLLRNLIIAAVLVNFSFLIAGAVIDASNVFGNFFLGASSPNGDIIKFGDNLANSLSIQRILDVKPAPGNEKAGALLKFGGNFLAAFASLAATVIFGIVLVITFFAIAVMLLIRYVWISFLLIVMPLAWLSFTIPTFSGQFSNWWKKFIHWNIFYPIVTLFLYLGVESSQKMGAFIQNSTLNDAAGPLAAGANLSSLAPSTIAVFIQIFLQVALMFGGLYAANQLGVTGATKALELATGAKDRILGGAKRAGRAVGGVTAGPAIAAGGAGLASLGARVLNAPLINRIPGAKGAAANLSSVATASKVAAANQKLDITKKQKEELGKDTNEALLIKFNAYQADPGKRAALANEVAKRGLVDKVDQERLDSYFEDAKRLGVTKDIEENVPHLAYKVADYDKTFEEAQKRNPAVTKASLPPNSSQFKEFATQLAMEKFRPAKTETLGAEAIQQTAKFFRKEHLERLAKEGDVPQLFAAAKAARELSKTEPEHPLVKFSIENPAMQQVNLPEHKKIIEELQTADARRKEEASKSKPFETNVKKEPGKPSAPGL